MRSPLLAAAVWLTTTWTRVYTWGMDPLERDERRKEIESDIWESEHDEADSDVHIACHVLARLAGGLANDIRWRAEHPSVGSVRALVAVGTSGLIAAALWLLFFAQIGAVPVIPPPPPAPPLIDRFSIPPPPPPPPPPAPCSGCPRPSIEVREQMRVVGAPR